MGCFVCYNDGMTLVKDCEVCEFLPNNDPIFETDKWAVSLAPDQGYLGRCFVTLKDHKGDMSDLTDEEWREFIDIVKKLEARLRKAFGATLFNWSCLMNNAFQVTPARPHVHWHVRPRYELPVNFEGEEFVDPLFGHHYDSLQSKKPDDEMMNKIRLAVKASL